MKKAGPSATVHKRRNDPREIQPIPRCSYRILLPNHLSPAELLQSLKKMSFRIYPSNESIIATA